MGTANVLEAARVHGLRRVVVASSSALAEFLAGGEDAGELQKEEAFPRPTTFYAATKQAKESLGINYARWCGIDYVGLRFASVAGPWSGSTSRTRRARCLLTLAAEGLQDRVFNVGMGRLYRPEDLVAAIGEVVPGTDSGIEPLLAGALHTDPIPPLDLQRSRRTLGYESAFDMAQAIGDFAAWARALQDS